MLKFEINRNHKVNEIIVEGTPMTILADLSFVICSTLEAIEDQTEGHLKKQDLFELIQKGVLGWWEHDQEENKGEFSGLDGDELEKVTKKLDNISELLNAIKEQTTNELNKRKAE